MAAVHWTTRLKQILVDSVSQAIDQRTSSKGAALAFYTLFSMMPILLLAMSIASNIFGSAPAQVEIAARLDSLFGKAAASFLLALLKSTQTSGAGFTTTILASLLLILAATSVFAELKGSLDELLGISKQRPSAFLIFLKTRLLSFSLVIVLAFLLLVSIVLSAGLIIVESYADRVWGSTALLIATSSIWLISFGVTAFLFALIYKTLPEIQLPWRDVWVGALVTSGLFSLGKYAIGVYLSSSDVASGFGAAGSLVALILWVYYSAQIFFFGAIFTRYYAYAFGSLKDTSNTTSDMASLVGRNR